MNSIGCPAGLVTDEAFQPNTPASCDTNLAGFYAFAMITATLKMLAGLKQLSNWLARPSHRAKVPRGPLISLIGGFIEFGIFVLVGFNVVNYYNGFSFSVFSLLFLSFAWSYSVGLVRLVRLGDKILPKSTRDAQSGPSNIGRFDHFGKVLLTLQIVCIGASSLALIILSPVFRGKEEVVSRIGWGTKGLFMTFCLAGYVYQFERCIRVIRLTDARAKNIRSKNVIDQSSPAADDLDKVVRKMRVNQSIHIFATGPATATFLVLAAGLVPAATWVVILTLLFDAIGSLSFEFMVKARSSGGHAKGSKQQHSKPSSGKDQQPNMGIVPLTDTQAATELSSTA